MQGQHKQHKCNTSATQETPVQNKCNTFETDATQVGHECDTQKNDFLNGRLEIFKVKRDLTEWN